MEKDKLPATEAASSCWFCLLLSLSLRLRWQEGGFVTRQLLSREDACLLSSCLSLPPQPRQSLRHSDTARRWNGVWPRSLSEKTETTPSSLPSNMGVPWAALSLSCLPVDKVDIAHRLLFIRIQVGLLSSFPFLTPKRAIICTITYAQGHTCTRYWQHLASTVVCLLSFVLIPTQRCSRPKYSHYCKVIDRWVAEARHIPRGGLKILCYGCWRWD